MPVLQKQLSINRRWKRLKFVPDGIALSAIRHFAYWVICGLEVGITSKRLGCGEQQHSRFRDQSLPKLHSEIALGMRVGQTKDLRSISVLRGQENGEWQLDAGLGYRAILQYSLPFIWDRRYAFILPTKLA